MKNILPFIVTTPSHFPLFNNASDSKLVLLGEDLRCPYSVPSEKLDLVKYHWCDDSKRSRDYEYLADLYSAIISHLASALNKLHGLSEDERYWEIILAPWLVVYVSSFYDRWEMLRGIVDKYGEFEMFEESLCEARKPPLDYEDFIQTIAYSDELNHKIFTMIAEHHRKNGSYIKFRKNEDRYSFHPPKSSLNEIKTSYLVRVGLVGIRSYVRNILKKIDGLNSSQSILLLQASYFPEKYLKKLVKLLNVPIGLDINFKKLKFIDNSNSFLRGLLKKNLHEYGSSSDTFFNFCINNICEFIPATVLENYQKLKLLNSKMLQNVTVIFTANSHFSNEGFKIWAAERVRLGGVLIISEHGGSIPARDYLFRFEERIADIFTTTYIPSHSKHIQLPPSTFIGRKPVKRRDASKLLIVVFPAIRWVVRASSHPTGLRALDICAMLENLKGGLDPLILHDLSIKLPQSGLGWKLLEERYKSLVTNSVNIFSGRLIDAIEVSKIVICTYPQTTFTDAMLSGVPTIILFNPDFNRLEKNSDYLIGEMLRVGICFFDPLLAAAHINKYWLDPEEWWSSPDVVRVRKLFLSDTMNATFTPLNAWEKFFKAALESGPVKLIQ